MFVLGTGLVRVDVVSALIDVFDTVIRGVISVGGSEAVDEFTMMTDGGLDSHAVT